MSTNAALFLFLAAAVVAVFAFISIVVWVSAHSKERLTRDRFALMKTLVEHPGENADRVLAMLRNQDESRIERKEQEERKGYLVGGLVTLAAGVGVCIMLAAVEAQPRAWTAGLIPLTIGAALLAAGLFMKPGKRSGGQSSSEDE